MAVEGSFGPETVLCISIAERPGKFGYTMFNAAFKHLGLDMAYKPFCVPAGADLDAIVRAVRELGIRGIGVSMPHKERLMESLDEIDPVAVRIGAVNTIINRDGVLYGTNTDYLGVRDALEDAGVNGAMSALVLGAGGVAKAVVAALADLGASVTITNRTPERAQELARRYDAAAIPWEDRVLDGFDVLVNATSIGMSPDDGSLPVSAESLGQYKLVVDLVAKPPLSLLIRKAQEHGIATITGADISIRQAALQFELYTEIPAPLDVMREAAAELMRNG